MIPTRHPCSAADWPDAVLLLLYNLQFDRSPDGVRDAIRAALEEREFQKSIRERISEAIAEFLSGIFRWNKDVTWTGSLVNWIILILLILILIALLVHLGWTLWHALAVASRTRRHEVAAAEAPSDTAEELARRAEAALANGDYLQSMRLHFAACVLILTKVGKINILPGFTHHEILERGGAEAAHRERLAPLVDRLDHAWFGGAGAGLNDAREFQQYFREISAVKS